MCDEAYQAPVCSLGSMSLDPCPHNLCHSSLSSSSFIQLALNYTLPKLHWLACSLCLRNLAEMLFISPIYAWLSDSLSLSLVSDTQFGTNNIMNTCIDAEPPGCQDREGKIPQYSHLNTCEVQWWRRFKAGKEANHHQMLVNFVFGR